MEPYEVVAGPIEFWLAPVGEAFPAVNAAPAGNWNLLGTTGDENYDDDGVSVNHNQNVETWTPLGSTGPVKAWRTEEGLTFQVTLVDLSAAEYARVLNDATVTQTASGVGVPGTARFGLRRGHDVATFALVARADMSPAGDGLAMQYEAPIVFQSDDHEVTFQKGEPAGLSCTFTVLEDQGAATDEERFGRLVIQTAAAG